MLRQRFRSIGYLRRSFSNLVSSRPRKSSAQVSNTPELKGLFKATGLGLRTYVQFIVNLNICTTATRVINITEHAARAGTGG